MIPILQPKTAQLLIIDIQGKLANIVADSEMIVDNTEMLVKPCWLLDLPSVWVEQNPEGLGSTHYKLKTLLEEQTEMLPKHTFSALQCEEIKAALNQNARNQIIVCGIEAHVCVYQTVTDLLKEGFEVHLVTDAVSSRQVHSKNIAVNKMASYGAVPCTAEMAIFELMKSHKHPKFREILKLLK